MKRENYRGILRKVDKGVFVIGANAHWKPGNRCTQESIRNKVHYRLKNEESSVHTFYDIVKGMEGDLEEEIQDGTLSGEEDQEKEDHATVLFRELEVFDKLNRN